MTNETALNTGFKNINYNSRTDLENCKAFETKAVYVILKAESYAGKIIVSYSGNGVVVNIYDFENHQAHQARAGGNGYDRLTASLDGYVFGHYDLKIHDRGATVENQLQVAGYTVLQVV